MASTRVLLWVWTLVVVGVALPAAVGEAQNIVRDGTIGPKLGTPGVVEPTTPTYTIGSTLGRVEGKNLFHSFRQFNLIRGETAIFTEDRPLPTSITNIISRVTGGPSSIDGRISVDKLQPTIAGANLFLLNPAGVMFGANASLDISGSFHVSTADFLRFTDGTTFSARPVAGEVLTSAQPTAFGFLGQTPPAAISILGSRLQVPNGQTLTVVGGEAGPAAPAGIQITGGALLPTLGAPGGVVQLASVASAGEATLSAPGVAPDLNVSSFSSLGRIDISARARLDASRTDAGGGAGTVLIRGGHLIVNNSTLQSNTAAVDAVKYPGQLAPIGIDIQTSADVTLTSAGVLTTASTGAGRAGDISVRSGTVTLTNAGTLIRSLTTAGGRGGDITVSATDAINLSAPVGVSEILSQAQSTGKGGDMTISAGSLTLNAGGRIRSSSLPLGAPIPGHPEAVVNAGNIEVRVGSLTAAGGGQIVGNAKVGGTATVNLVGQTGKVTVTTDSANFSGTNSGIQVTSDTGVVGAISLNTGSLTLSSGAKIVAGTIAGPGASGGSIDVTATGPVLISSRGGLSSQSSTQAAGLVSVSAPTLTIDNGFINTSTLGSGSAGGIKLTVGTLTLTGGGQVASSSQTGSTGPGGSVTVTADSVSISGRSSSGVGPTFLINDARSGLFSATASNKPGGDINVQAGRILLSDGATVTAQSTGTKDANAGNLTLTSTGAFSIHNSAVTTQATTADGGNITLRAGAGSMVDVVHSQITTSVQSGKGHGGNIVIDPHIVLLDHSAVRADAFGGPGGNINIVADIFLANDSIVSASSVLSTPGTINIQAQISDLSQSTVPLPAGLLQAATLLRASCAARVAAGKSSSLVVAGRDGLPPAPGGYLPSLQLALDWSDNGSSPIVGLDGLPQLSQVALDSKCSR